MLTLEEQQWAVEHNRECRSKASHTWSTNFGMIQKRYKGKNLCSINDAELTISLCKRKVINCYLFTIYLFSIILCSSHCPESYNPLEPQPAKY